MLTFLSPLPAIRRKDQSCGVSQPSGLVANCNATTDAGSQIMVFTLPPARHVHAGCFFDWQRATPLIRTLTPMLFRRRRRDSSLHSYQAHVARAFGGLDPELDEAALADLLQRLYACPTRLQTFSIDASGVRRGSLSRSNKPYRPPPSSHTDS